MAGNKINTDKLKQSIVDANASTLDRISDSIITHNLRSITYSQEQHFHQVLLLLLVNRGSILAEDV